MDAQTGIHSAWTDIITWARRMALMVVVGLMALQVAGPASLARAAAARTSEPDIGRIDAFVSEQVRRHGIPGIALGLVEGDRIIHLQGFGKADQTGRAVTPQTPVDLASVSKPLTALAVMQLVEAGKVELDAPVQRYLPAFRVADPVASAQITVRHLLQHTSGIPVTACDTRVDAVTLEQYVAELQTVELDRPVGARHEYCSGNYNVLGRIIEVVSGQSYASYMQQQVFAPLQMRHSFTSAPEAQRDGLAQEYRWLFGLRVPAQSYFTPSQLPSGYLMSSAEDMCHFLIAQLNGGRFGDARVLSPQGIAAMHAPGVAAGTDGKTYGLGWMTESIGGVSIVRHDGGHPNVRTFLFLEPDLRRGAVVLINSFSLLADATAFTAIREGVARLLAGQEPAPASSLSLPTLYLIVDAVLAALLALALWPLLRMRRWNQRLRQHYQAGGLRRLRLGLRLGWELGLPLLLLIGVRLLLGSMGAQSWYEGLITFPDFIAWLWAISLVLLLTGILRGVLVLRTWRSTHQTSSDARRGLAGSVDGVGETVS
jgi:CubicO group peptidase (beta-lactamase class C family)